MLKLFQGNRVYSGFNIGSLMEPLLTTWKNYHVEVDEFENGDKIIGHCS